METMELALLIVLVSASLALIAIILLQQGKGASIGAAFGSGASNTVFGSSGATTFMTRVTTWLAVMFFVTTFALAWVAKQRAVALDDFGIPTVESPAGMVRDPADPSGRMHGATESMPPADVAGDLPPTGDARASSAGEASPRSDVPAPPVD